MPHHLAWQPGQAEIAAEGGADQRSAKIAASYGRMHQSREAHLAALPHHSPEGALTSTDALGQRSQGYATPARRE
jgi:hypothetical protein